METSSRNDDSHSGPSSTDSDLLVKALKNTFELLGGAEQKENLFRFLRNEYGISLDRPDEISEKRIATALTALFGSGAELLICRLREENAKLKSHRDKPIDRQLPKVETL
ncbi:MAG TPA: hypothetical protein VLA68_02005 [Nitrososphaera sp.]|nr:hypothetical protein [Nitrososphaera sp.]